jgi:predicted AlkP superfamily phosphohydrolase/phosphomutase
MASEDGARSGRRETVPDPGKRKTLRTLGALGALALVDAGALSSCARRIAPTTKEGERLILLGIDGLDPGIMGRMLAQGRLPNLARLREMGGFRRLRTTTPPQSPVAWATLITGRNPGVHGIYDFIHRDPRTYQLMPSIAQTAPPEYTLPLASWKIPLSDSRVDLLRRGEAFWEALEAAGVPCRIHQVPSNFPPRNTGTPQLAGLGTPDLRGNSACQCHYFVEGGRSDEGKVLQRGVAVTNGHVAARLRGPRNSLRRGMPESTVDFEVWLDREHGLAKIVIQGQQIVLRQGEWSGWIPVTFTLVPHVKDANGICRFYLKEAAPRFKLYVTPLNFDPMDPPLPIDAPPGFARQLAERHGRFHTAGLPEDTEALMGDALDDGEYLQQAGDIFAEARRLYESALDEFRRGLLFCYFGTTDRNQHMFWRTMDPRHPMYDGQAARDFGGVVEECYRVSDELAGVALDACDKQTTLIVFSDHGFAPFYRRVNLNNWLADHGYLALSHQRQDAELGRDADWSRTTAYAIGLNGLYLNLRGREGQGVVAPEDRQTVARRLAADLETMRDPETGERPIAKVYLADEAYSTRIEDITPDLIVGYARGYRSSTWSGGGVLAAAEFEDNSSKWSGDHCIDQAAVPGVLLANRPIGRDGLGLADVTATALAEFGVKSAKEIEGAPIW